MHARFHATRESDRIDHPIQKRVNADCDERRNAGGQRLSVRHWQQHAQDIMNEQAKEKSRQHEKRRVRIA